MKKLLFIVIFIVFIFTIQNYNLNAAELKKDSGYISLNNTVTKEVEPNVARINFSIENTAEDAQKATSENNEISVKIIEALKNISNTTTDVIKTNNFSVRPVYKTLSNGKREIKNYMAVNSITVQTSDISKVPKFIDTAISNGANRTDGLSYSFENEKSVCTQMYSSIIKDLKSQADTIAQAAGTSVDGIKQVNVSCSVDSVVSNGRFYMAKAVNSASGDVMENAQIETPIEAGKAKIRVYVNTDFYVK